MEARELEEALRDPNKGSVSLRPGERMHIILMLHNKVKPRGGGYFIHIASQCLQVVHGDSCDCGLSGETQWFPSGAGGEIKTYDIQPITWKWDDFARRSRMEAVNV